MAPPQLTPFEHGLIVGLLIGEGHFGGDGKQPQITVKMHVRHERILRLLADRFPRSRLYGPYNYDKRHFYQWMARGDCLAQDVLPLLEEARIEEIDDHCAKRIAQMRERYGGQIARSSQV